MADKKKAEKVEPEKVEKEAPKKEVVDVDAFIARKLFAINEMDNEALAEFLAQRVLNNKRGK